MSKEALLIGVDGGASEVKAHAVDGAVRDNHEVYVLRGESASRVYERVADFVPTPIGEQLRQREADAIKCSSIEAEQARRWVAAACDAIAELAAKCGASRVRVGMGMPGLKTADQRGISVINNGPRMPDYLDQLERMLADAGVELEAPVRRLGSDADYCGVGEQRAAQGAFAGANSAYYIGCGTGIADALKLDGDLVAFDQVEHWMLKSWRMASSLGPTYEQLVSAASLNRVYQQMIRCAGGDEATMIFPEQAALDGDLLAESWLDTAAHILAELIFERIDTIHNGRANAPWRGESYIGLTADHPYRGFSLDRVVIGQQLGRIYGDRQYELLFAVKLDRYLAAYIRRRGASKMIEAYVSDGGLRRGFVVASKLRAAPALGAAIDAASFCA